jgi:hypothetical protein
MINLYTWWYGPENKIYSDCIERNRENAMRFGYNYIVNWNTSFEGSPVDASIAKDLEAMTKLCTEDCIVCDADLVINEPLFFEYDGAYAAYENNLPSIALMASIGDKGKQWFRTVLSEKMRRGIQDCHCWFMKIFRDDGLESAGLSSPYVIPECKYSHLRMQCNAIELAGKRELWHN